MQNKTILFYTWLVFTIGQVKELFNYWAKRAGLPCLKFILLGPVRVDRTKKQDIFQSNGMFAVL